MNHHKYKDPAISGRYVSPQMLQLCLSKWEDFLDPDLKAESVLGHQIPVYRLGKGTTTILLWSQMHGNESTTTKALVDVVHFLQSNEPQAIAILKSLHLVIIPMLNPDGSAAYTRSNAKGVDLNRDFVDQSQPESQFLVSVFNAVKPQFCFNLHDQRTIFGAGHSPLAATLSFLGPAADAQRSVTPSRKVSMQVIAAIYQQLQKFIPGRIGRYDDSYNPNCAGDFFQSLNVPTLLFEAGHIGVDYQREETRTWVYESILAAFAAIENKSYLKYREHDYHEIPENQKNHLDMQVLNAHLINPKIQPETTLAFQYEEQLNGLEIDFIPKIIERSKDQETFFHAQLDFSVESAANQSLANQNIIEQILTLGD